MQEVPPASARWWQAAFVGIALLAVLTAIKLAIPALGRSTPFLTYFVAVLVAGWQGGMRAGFLVTVVSAVNGYAWFISGSPGVTWTSGAIQVGVFCLEGMVISWISARAYTDRARIRTAMLETRDAVDQLQGVLNALEVGVTMQDANGDQVYANEAAAHISGRANPDDFLATPTSQLMEAFEVLDVDGNPLPRERLPNWVLLAGGEPQDMLVQFQRRGTHDPRFAWLASRAIRAADGALRFVVNTFGDVTEARHQEEALRVSREWFSTALRSIGDAVIATDAKGLVTFINPVGEEVTGWSAAEAEGRPLSEVFPILDEDTRQPIVSPVEKVIREGHVVGLGNHTILVRRDGTEIAIDDSAAPIRASDGTLDGVVLAFRDVTAGRREAIRREFLARATETLSSTLDFEATLATVVRLAVPQLADWCALDVLEDGQIRRLGVAHTDPSKVRLLEELERRHPLDPNGRHGVPEILRSGKAELVPLVSGAHMEAYVEAAAHDQEYLRILRELPLHSYIGVPLMSAGKAFGVISLMMAESRRVYDEDDLAFATALADRASVAVENARLFRAVEQARADAVLASRAKDDFLAMLGHELRNPLAPILTSLELMRLQPGASTERAREVIERQVRGMVRLVDDLLDVSRIAHGRVELTQERVELAELVVKGLEVAAPLIEQRAHRVEISVGPGLVVHADPLRLTQVVGNLLTNAAKYTERGGHICIVGEAEGDEVVLRVRDDGVGISPQMLPQIFEVFVQQPQAIDRAQGGLGLGLTIVKSLVELHGGRVSAHSEGPGRGSEMVVCLPAASKVEAAAPGSESSAPAGASSAATRVLLVDDNVDALEMLAELLRMLGYEVHTATDGESALVVAQRVRPVIGLLDIGLPVIDGYELGRRLRAIPGLERIELVAITGYGQPSDEARSAAAGFAAHLVKPVGIAEIRRVLGERTRALGQSA